MTQAKDCPGPTLRIAVLGDFDGPHTRAWLDFFVERGHEVHAISYYQPREDLRGVKLYVLRGGTATSTPAGKATGVTSATGKLRRAVPASVLRFVHAWRYRRAGLRATLRAIAPDVLHAHYVVEHGFYGLGAGFRPYVVSGWGSDVFMAPRTPLNRLIVRRVLRRADIATANAPAMARRLRELGARRVEVVRLGIADVFFDEPGHSVNLLPPGTEPPTIISDRALEPLYNIDLVLRAFARLRERLPTARLVVANDGSRRGELEALFALSTLEAMAVGAFPVVADLPSQGLIRDGVNGLRLPAGDIEALTAALLRALADDGLRRGAVAINRDAAEQEARRATNMLRLERIYYELAGKTSAGTTDFAEQP